MMRSSCSLIRPQSSPFFQTPRFSHLTTHTPAYTNAQLRLSSSPSGAKIRIKHLAVKSQHQHQHHSNATATEELKESMANTDAADTGLRRSLVIAGAAAVGVAVALMMGADDKAWAMGPEGPMVEEFWENVRRYALYALTVSTGVLYTVFQPIFELLKNPISAVLVVIIIGGSIFIVSQILSAMVGVSDFNYDYAY